MIRLLLILVKYNWIFSISPFNKLKNKIYTYYYKSENTMAVGKHCTIGIAHYNENNHLIIGKDFEIGNFALLDYSGGLEIGNGVTVSESVKIYTHNHTFNNRNFSWRSQPISFSPLKIGDDVWIGAGAIILESVSSVGKGAIIGAGSVVVNNIPNYSVAVGNPARVIKTRGKIN